MSELVLVRHGQSVWNAENRFTGWVDVDLTLKGEMEAKAAAEKLLKHGLTFDSSHTSVLKRAIRTLWLILQGMDLCWVPVRNSWRLNERHYGALQGLNKKETAEKYGEEQVHLWRRGFSALPPELSVDDKANPASERRYADIPKDLIPRGESLEVTLLRVRPYWDEILRSELKKGRSVLVVAHGNSLRALMCYLESLSSEEIISREIGTGEPVVYSFNEKLEILDKKLL